MTLATMSRIVFPAPAEHGPPPKQNMVDGIGVPRATPSRLKRVTSRMDRIRLAMPEQIVITASGRCLRYWGCLLVGQKFNAGPDGNSFHLQTIPVRRSHFLAQRI
jgi:hypothetical protein